MKSCPGFKDPGNAIRISSKSPSPLVSTPQLLNAKVSDSRNSIPLLPLRRENMPASDADDPGPERENGKDGQRRTGPDDWTDGATDQAISIAIEQRDKENPPGEGDSISGSLIQMDGGE